MFLASWGGVACVRAYGLSCPFLSFLSSTFCDFNILSDQGGQGTKYTDTFAWLLLGLLFLSFFCVFRIYPPKSHAAAAAAGPGAGEGETKHLTVCLPVWLFPPLIEIET